MRRAVILFTRVPVKGKVKTRMQPLLNPEECKKLQECMILDAVKTCKNGNWDLFISYTPQKELMKIKGLCGDAVDYFPQEGDGLGDKMADAVGRILELGHDSCILVGSDIPDMRAKDIEDGFQILETKEVVLGPTLDKGYYLVGMKKATREVFEKQTYGIGNVLEETVNRIQCAGISYGLTNSYQDMDVPEDIYRFYCENADKSAEYAENTRKYVKYLMEVYKDR